MFRSESGLAPRPWHEASVTVKQLLLLRLAILTLDMAVVLVSELEHAVAAKHVGMKRRWRTCGGTECYQRCAAPGEKKNHKARFALYPGNASWRDFGLYSI